MPTIEKFMGTTEAADPARFVVASPIDRVDGAAPPFLMIVGDADPTTPVTAHEAMLARLTASGVWAKLVVLPGVKHGFGYGVTTPDQLETVRLAGDFLADVLAARG